MGYLSNVLQPDTTEGGYFMPIRINRSDLFSVDLVLALFRRRPMTVTHADPSLKTQPSV
jgi:hypothetical protein